jgi:AraC family transcriptional regulator of adaptative response / DNA-3-methyladenine glycosylase II
VARALKILAAGPGPAVDVEELSGRLGVGSRHLRRLFIEHLGASPRAVAGTRRAHFARKLLDQTDLPMTEVALAAGYSSLRRCNDAIRQTYHLTPTTLRRQAREAPRSAAPAGSLELRIPYHQPFDAARTIAYIAGRATPGVESVTNGVYRRSIEWQGAPGWFEMRPTGDGRTVTLSVSVADTRDLLGLAEKAGRILDLGADPRRIHEFLARDPVLRPTLKRFPGLRVPGAWDPFELAVRAILGQQVSVAGATTLAGRLAARFGKPLAQPPAPGLTHLHPRPEDLAEADVAVIGIPAARARTIRSLARAVATGQLDFQAMKEVDDVVEALTVIEGIGDWTAQYVAMRALGEPDAFPAGDLGIRKALAVNGILPSTREVLERSEAWRPWRAYAAIALWTSLKPPASKAKPQ